MKLASPGFEVASHSVLDIDLGNSAMKYRLGERMHSLRHCADGAVDVAAIDLRSDADSSNKSIERIRVCSVLSDEQNAVFVNQAFDRWGVHVEFARSEASVGDVTNGYRDASVLGVDRWLAVLAGYKRSGTATLVIDLGTAITLDYVLDDGAHIGGYIVPGTHLMQKALLKDTAAIRFSGASLEPRLAPGFSTDEAISRGTLVMVRNLIEVEVERFHELCHHAPVTILCGGGAKLVANHLQCSCEIVPELVLDGLSVALP